MSRWSIANIARPVSRAQFIDLTTQFQKAAETSFGTACSLEIRAMNAVRMTSTFLHDDGTEEFMAAENERRTFFKTGDPNQLTDDAWRRAAYVEVIVRPDKEKQAPAYAFGHAEFKGHLPRQATFYLQPDDDASRDTMVNASRGKWIGEGYDSNSYRSAGPDSWRFNF